MIPYQRQVDINQQIIRRQRQTAQKILVNHLLMDRSGNIHKYD